MRDSAKRNNDVPIPFEKTKRFTDSEMSTTSLSKKMSAHVLSHVNYRSTTGVASPISTTEPTITARPIDLINQADSSHDRLIGCCSTNARLNI